MAMGEKEMTYYFRPWQFIIPFPISFSFKSLRSLLMYLAYLVCVFSDLLLLPFYVFFCHSAGWHVTAKVKSPLLSACHLVPLHNHPEWAVITPPSGKGIGRTALLREMSQWTPPSAPALGSVAAELLRMAARILRQQVSVNIETSPCRAEWNNFH